MSIDALIATITADAEARERELLAAADARVGELRAEVERDVAHRRKRDLEAMERAHGRRTAAELAAAELGARRVVLHAREQVVDRVLAAVVEASRRGDESAAWQQRVPDLVDAALRYLGGADAVLVCRGAAEPAVRDAARGRARVDVDADAPPGLLARSADGSVVIDATITADLRHARVALRRAALRELGGPR